MKLSILSRLFGIKPRPSPRPRAPEKIEPSGDYDFYRPGESPDAEETYVVDDDNGQPSGTLKVEK